MTDEALTARAGALAVRGRTMPALTALLVAAAVALQIGYPLVHGAVRDRLSVLIVVLLAAACVAHAGATRGARTAVLLLAGTALPGFAVEVLGVQTGVPFGSYRYAATLGPRLWGVPPVIGLAWTMLAWPAALVARRLVRGRVPRVVVGGWALAAADLFLDPQQVAAGHWRWRHSTPHLPGVPDVPLTNYAGWLLVALLLSLAVERLAGADVGRDDRLMLGLYLWLYAGWTLALAAFLDLAAAAGWGALGMGLAAVPLAARCLRRA